MALAAAALLLIVVLAGCRVGAEVAIDVADDGSGSVAVEVRLDPDAAARVPDLVGQLRVDDLRAAGWEVSGPTPAPDGSVTVAARQGFARPEDAGPTVAEVTGLGGPLGAVELTRRTGFGSVRTGFGGTLDVPAGAATFADPELIALLGGRSVEELVAGGPLGPDDEAHLRVSVRLPGEVTGNGRRAGERMAWEARLGDPSQPLLARGVQRSTTATTARTVAIVAAGAAG